ncbi:MAG: sugar phosphate isomerase/epimerase [Planctomycetes bacterium]|nr:sugar phosphate isomerase/epimerase [Planctomycetota bacterium]
MTLTRRVFLAGAAALGGAAAWAKAQAAEAGKAAPRIRLSSCNIGSLQNAKAAGLDGMEVAAGGAAEKLSIADPATRQKYKDQMKETGLAVSSVMMSVFNSNPLASDPNGPAWLEQTIEGARDLGAQVILVAFFGKGSLKEGDGVKKADADVVVERLKAAAPKAAGAGVVLGIENTLTAQQNMEILQRIGHPSVKIYYDIYNLAGQGYDTPAEIRLLRDKCAIFHFKNGPDYLETGKVKWEPNVAAINEIGYRGWIVLESSAPSKDRVADDRRNAAYVRKLFA